jgi:ribonuclease HI
MSKNKKKFFVVWEGFNPGIYQTWKECQLQTDGFSKAKYKSFPTYELAKKALSEGPENYWGKDRFFSSLTDEELKLIGDPIKNSMTVDAGCQGIPGPMDYQGVDFFTGEVVFRKGPFLDSTQNIGEYLAIVHALAHMKKKGDNRPIYSDSRNAISWIKNKGHRTNLVPSELNKDSFELLRRADKWLKENTYSNKILKWETKAWGEIPADFGRK